MNKKAKIMLVQEKNEHSSHCEKIFSSYGFDVICVEKDGSKVMEYIKINKPDIVIMDAFMPGNDALGVLGQLKKESLTKRPMMICFWQLITLALRRS